MRRWARRAAVAGLLATVAVVLGAAPAAAAEDLVIRTVDTRNFPEVELSALVTGGTPDLGTFQLRENGRLLDQRAVDVVPLSDTGIDVGVVLALDVSGSMTAGNALAEAKAAAKRFVAEIEPGTEMALVAFGSQARVVVNFTTDRPRLSQAIDELAAGGDTAMYDAVRKAVALFQERPGLQPNVVVLADGADDRSNQTRREAIASAVAAKATVFTIGIETQTFDEGFLRELATDTGGDYVPVTQPDALQGAYAAVRTSLESQYLVSWTSRSSSSDLEIVLSADGVRDEATVTVGSLASGQTTEPRVISGSQVPGFLSGTIGKLLVVVLGGLAALLLVFAVIQIFVSDDVGLADQLKVYTDPSSGPEDEGSGIMRSAAVKSAVGIAERFTERRGFQPRIESMLERANLPLRAGEAVFFWLAAVVVGTLLAALLTRAAFGAFLGLVITVAAPPAALNVMAGQRQRKFVSQLPDTLQLLSGSLRAGYSLMQGVEAVSQEVDDPMGRELRRIVAETRLGLPLEDALDQSAGRMGSDDFAWAIMAIKIQREVGGNLAELLDTVADTMIARERLRREVRALTAEGRISAIVLGILPVGLLLMIWTLNPDYLDPLFEETLGQVILIGGGLLALAGFYWLKKIVEIKL